MKIIRFAFAHKTASMFAHQILTALSQAEKLPYFSPNNSPANHGDLRHAIKDASDGTILFGPSRDYQISELLSGALAQGHELYDICQIRHPLDVLVSQYFSHGWIHPDGAWSDTAKEQRKRLQEGALSMVDYIRMELRGEAAFSGKSIIKKFHELEKDVPNVRRRIVRYEQFYHDYDSWADGIATFLPAELELKPLLSSMRPSYDNVQVLEKEVFYENPLEYVEEFQIGRGSHIRTAAPGDYLHFLSQEEIETISAEIAATCPTLVSQYGEHNNTYTVGYRK